MCSSRWEMPICARDSCAPAVRTHTPTATDRTAATRSVRTVTPLGAMVRRTSSSRRTVCTGAASGLLEQRLPGEPHAAALVDLEQLDPDRVALLDHVLGPLGAAVLQLRDVQQAFDAGEDLDEGAEGGGALHHALVDRPDVGGLEHLADQVARLLAAAADGRDGHGAGVVHVDLGAGLLLQRPDVLALGADQLADPVG